VIITVTGSTGPLIEAGWLARGARDVLLGDW
jgi:hypothetical protein